jgi:hypothetical protein
VTNRGAPVRADVGLEAGAQRVGVSLARRARELEFEAAAGSWGVSGRSTRRGLGDPALARGLRGSS